MKTLASLLALSSLLPTGFHTRNLPTPRPTTPAGGAWKKTPYDIRLREKLDAQTAHYESLRVEREASKAN